MTTKNNKKENSAMTPEINSDNVRKAIKSSIAKIPKDSKVYGTKLENAGEQLEISGETIKPTLPEKSSLDIEIERMEKLAGRTAESLKADEIKKQAIIDTMNEEPNMTEGQREEFLALQMGESDRKADAYDKAVYDTLIAPEPEYKSSPLYLSHEYVKGGEPLRSPKSILEKLLPFLGEDNLILEGTMPVTIAENGENKTAFARGKVVKSYSIDEAEGLTYEVGFLYAYDLGKPCLKVFSGVKVRACTNLCIFEADDVQNYLVGVNAQGAYDKMSAYIADVYTKIEKAKQTVMMLKNTFLDKPALTDFFGRLLFSFTAVENIAGITCITEAAESLQNPKHLNFFDTRPVINAAGNREPAKTSLWNVYNALTNKFAKKEILSQPEKVLSIFREVAPLMYAN